MRAETKQEALPKARCVPERARSMAHVEAATFGSRLPLIPQRARKGACNPMELCSPPASEWKAYGTATNREARPRCRHSREGDRPEATAEMNQ
eukprot:6630350-Alexandrium_andersonii.AAC.1